MFRLNFPWVTKLKEYSKMKSITYNSNSASFISGKDSHPTFEFTQKNAVKLNEKTITKGKVKFFLGMVYFAALMYSLFILLT